MKTVQTELAVPEWEKPCWVVAFQTTLNLSEDKIRKLARSNGWDGKSSGIPIRVAISMAWDLIGKMPNLDLTKVAKGKTARAFSGTQTGTGLVFTKSHVMPMVNGKLSNYNGHGEEEVVAVALLK